MIFAIRVINSPSEKVTANYIKVLDNTEVFRQFCYQIVKTSRILSPKSLETQKIGTKKITNKPAALRR